MILTIRTDKPEAEIGLFNNDGSRVDYRVWEAHRQLSETIHKVITEIMKQNNITFQQLEGIVYYKGPGSFTGLRIGASVTNSLAGGLNIPSVSESTNDWAINGCRRIKAKENEPAVPFYGEEARTTPQKK